MADNSVSPFKLIRPTYSEAEIAETPWIIIELRIYDALALAVDYPDASDSSIASAAQDLNLLFPPNRPENLSTSGDLEDPASFLWEFWDVIAKVVLELPHNHPSQEQLIRLIETLRDLPDPVEIELNLWGTYKIWADLPILGPVFREALDRTDSEVINVNLEAFLARATRAGISNFSWLGLLSLHWALEVEPDDRAKAYEEQGPILDAQIPRALRWLEIAGKKLYEEVLVERFKDAGYATGGTWKVSRGFSKARWDHWKLRFGQVAVDTQPSEPTKELSRKALHRMVEIETLHGH
ncbi:hypothetical protein DFP72DRAFT_913346 [Ephemerocybe angulata]|uniref:Uncharacterized protein n=1 Tax=Ephemerocybe angulata TaxID=980116 RepID=A0A8H6M044_9AGAR|nr:hypothetical protein DFP72DRAFT_913346 [Tulosesus angulatus]